MSQPTRSDVHVSTPLTNISIAFIQSEADFVADRVFPVIPVQKQADKYFKYDKQQWFRSDAKKRAPATESAGSGFTISQDTYFADVIALHTDIADQIRANQDQPIDLDRDGTQFVTRQLLLRKEKDFMTEYMSTGVWSGGDASVTTKWNSAGSDPVADVKARARAIKLLTGFKPNKMVVSPNVDDALKTNASILDRMKITDDKVITNGLLARLFEMDEYLVAEAVEDTAVEGGTASMGHMVSEKVLLVYVERNPGIMKPSAGYTFAWSGLFGAQQGTRISKFRMEPLKADRVEGEMTYDQKLVSADLGTLMTDLLA